MKIKTLLTCLTALFIAACSGKKKPDEKSREETLITVSLTNPVIRSLTEKVSASGVLSSKSELKLAFKTGGMISRMYVQEGQSVKAGQLLAELDLSEIDAQVQQARLGLQKAERDLERVKKLYSDEAATLTQLQDATTAFDIAGQTVRTADFNQKLSKIYAPASGRILRKIAEQGELITPFSPALILGTGASAYLLNAGLSDKDLVRVTYGDQAEVMLDAYPGKIFAAKISQIAQTVNPATGTYEVELQLEPVSEKLVSGFVAKASIFPKSKTTGMLVPIECLVEADNSTAYVYVYEETSGKVTKKPVVTGRIIDHSVEIISGLQESEKIVYKGANFLSDNIRVNVAP